MNGKDYLEGFEDALDLLTTLTNKVGTQIATKPTTSGTLIKAIDSYISLTYIMKLQLGIMKDEYDDSAESCDENCAECDLSDIFDSIFNKEEI